MGGQDFEELVERIEAYLRHVRDGDYETDPVGTAAMIATCRLFLHDTEQEVPARRKVKKWVRL